MDFDSLISGMERFGTAREEVLPRVLGVSPKQIRENVVIAPGWEPDKVPGLGTAELISSAAVLFNCMRVWNVTEGGRELTYVKTGFGAPLLMDALLALGLSACKRILFVGSVGALDRGMAIGDLVVPEYSVCGDGASRYLASDDLKRDVFGERALPDTALRERLREETERVCGEHQVKWHVGRTFCSDTIFAQFAHMDAITGMNCNTIEMETAVAFRAAKMMGKPLAALFSVSDNTAAHRSLLSGITQGDLDYRQRVRGQVLPRILWNVFR